MDVKNDEKGNGDKSAEEYSQVGGEGHLVGEEGMEEGKGSR